MIWMASTTTREYAGCFAARLPVCSKSNLWGSCQRSGGINCSQPCVSRCLCLWGQHASSYLFTPHGSDWTHNPKETFALTASRALCLTLVLMIVSGIPTWNKGLSLKLLNISGMCHVKSNVDPSKKFQLLDWSKLPTAENLKPSLSWHYFLSQTQTKPSCIPPSSFLFSQNVFNSKAWN